MAEWIFALYLKAKKFLWLVPIRTGEYAVPHLCLFNPSEWALRDLGSSLATFW
jgi:hypothetical protein